FLQETGAGQQPFFDVRTCQPDAQFTSTWTPVKDAAVRIANEQFTHWTRPNGSRYNETDPAMTQRLQEYWAAVGLTVTAAQLQNSAWQEDHPWSAAFISWVMRQAGAGTAFTYASAHMRYVHAGKQNAEQRAVDNPFWTCAVTNALPEPGDLICRNRGNSRFTYDTIQSSGTSHCDLVTEVDYANNRMTVIGGNKSQTVNREIIRLTASGLVDTSAHGEIFAILKFRTDKCETCGTVAIV
ncbi:MAG TPA: DUF2272 domain-containing protein, partial [Chitinophagaceae bacterium]|nr:DUF2272 domain-containing protein [Chitinophagaceae bacterium]